MLNDLQTGTCIQSLKVSSYLGRQEADEVVEKVDPEAVGDNVPAIDREDPPPIEAHQDYEHKPAGVDVWCRPIHPILDRPGKRKDGRRNLKGGFGYDNGNNNSCLHLPSFARNTSIDDGSSPSILMIVVELLKH